jgi:hypothetical protein
MTTIPTREEIEDLVKFCREEASELEVDFSDVPDAVSRAQRLCAIAEKLPVLLAEPRYQQRVHDWILACFGEGIGADRIERNHRFLEEALETVQAGGCTRSEAHQLVDYVFDRPAGELWQEVGGVMNTLAAFCTAHGLDMAECGERELARVWTKVEAIRAKQAAKPKHSPLPQAHSPSSRETLKTAEPSAEATIAAGKTETRYDALCRAYAIDVAPLLAERDRLAAEVERLKRLCSGGDYDMLQSERAWKRRAEYAERESAAANAALQRIGMSLGSSDEWTDQATMIADVEGRVSAARETIAKLREALAKARTCVVTWSPCPDEPLSDIDAALAQLDAAPDATGHTDLMISPEAIDEALAANPLPEALATQASPITIDYTNWRGERRVREIVPLRIFFGSNEWHKEPQWLLEANDPEDGETKTFALTGIHGFGEDNRLAQAERAIAEAVEIMRPFAISVSEDGWLLRLPKDPSIYRAARAFVEKHGGPK